MAEQFLTLDRPELKVLFGTSDLPESASFNWYKAYLKYAPLSSEEEEGVLGEIRRHVASTKFGQNQKSHWDEQWQKNLKAFRDGHYLHGLVPHYYLADRGFLRINQHMVRPVEPRAELAWFKLFLSWLLHTHIKTRTVYEFGCGSGFNLVWLALADGGYRRYIGLDWSEVSAEILEEVRQAWRFDIHGRQFDLLDPDPTLQLGPNSTVLTVATLEQLGRDYEAFLQYLLHQKPALVVNIEPIVEWYDPDNPVDQTAILFHRARNYLEGFTQRLQEFQQDGKVEVLKMKRSYFGSLYTESYSQVIWRPL